MSNTDTRQNGNEPSSPFGSTSSSYCSDDDQLPGFENNPSSSPNLQDAPADGLQMVGRARQHPSHASDSSDSSSSEDEEDEPDPYHASMGNTRVNRWRGRHPAGNWKSRARKIDFSKSRSIESKIPPTVIHQANATASLLSLWGASRMRRATLFKTRLIATRELLCGES